MHVADKIDIAFSAYPKRKYDKGQILIYAGEDPSGIFYLKKGRVRQYDVSYKGDELTVNVFKPQAFFPMSWAFTRTPNTYFFKTEVVTEIHVIPVEAALEFVKSNPDVLLDLLQRLYKGTDGLLGRMVQLMAGSAQDRVLYELLLESFRFGEKTSNGSVKLVISEADLASKTGLSRETVSREIQKLKQKGIIRKVPGQILIKDTFALENLLRH